MRLAELAGREFDDQLEQEFWIVVTVGDELATQKNGRTPRLSRTRQKEKRVGVVRCLLDWALDPKVTQGFSMLVEAGRADLTGGSDCAASPGPLQPEALVAAEQKLRDQGVDPLSVRAPPQFLE